MNGEFLARHVGDELVPAGRVRHEHALRVLGQRKQWLDTQTAAVRAQLRVAAILSIDAGISIRRISLISGLHRATVTKLAAEHDAMTARQIAELRGIEPPGDETETA